MYGKDKSGFIVISRHIRFVSHRIKINGLIAIIMMTIWANFNNSWYVLSQLNARYAVIKMKFQ